MRCTFYKMYVCKIHAYGVHTYEVYTHDFDLSLTAPMSAAPVGISLCWVHAGFGFRKFLICPSRHTIVLSGM
jgi:hypothetical protein